MAKRNDAKLLFDRITNAKRLQGEFTEGGARWLYDPWRCLMALRSGPVEEHETKVNVFNFEIVHHNETQFSFIIWSHLEGGTCFRLLARDKATCRCSLQPFASRLPHACLDNYWC